MIKVWLIVASAWLVYLAVRGAVKFKKEPGEPMMRVLSIIGNLCAALLLQPWVLESTLGLQMVPESGVLYLIPAVLVACELVFLLQRVVTKLFVEWREPGGAQASWIANPRRILTIMCQGTALASIGIGLVACLTGMR